MDELIFSLTGIFGFSFLVALTGAMSPGPLLTYTIIQSVKGGSRGYLMGVWIIFGHAVIEMGIIILLLFGFSYVFRNPFLMQTVGLAGGLLLVWFGVSVIRNVYTGKVSTSFLTPANGPTETDHPPRHHALDNPVVGGALVSMSNPYWWIWWATIGLAFMLQFNISFHNWPELIAFFAGHEAGDLSWYLLVSCLAFFGLRRLNKRVYYGILVVCGIFMIGFGIYLGAAPFVSAASG